MNKHSRAVPSALIVGASVFECETLEIETTVVMLSCGHARCVGQATMSALVPCGDCLIGELLGTEQAKPTQITPSRLEELRGEWQDA